MIRHRWQYPLVMPTVPAEQRIAVRSKCGKELTIPADLIRRARAQQGAFDESRAMCPGCN